MKVAGPVKVDHFIQSSLNVGRFVNRLRGEEPPPPRWDPRVGRSSSRKLVHIESD
jgi:hypothetical protein